MYKDVMKKLTAWVLIMCMIGSVPDFSLWAASDAGSGASHTYRNEEGISPGTYNTNVTTAVAENTFTLDANNTQGMSAQQLTSVSFGLNQPNASGDTGQWIKTAEYSITVTVGGATATASGTYDKDSVDSEGMLSVAAFSGDTKFTPGLSGTVSVTISNAVWGADDNTTPNNQSVSFRVANLTAGTSKINGSAINADGGTARAACIRVTTEECTSDTDMTSLTAVTGPDAVPVGKSIQLGIDYEPDGADTAPVTWSLASGDEEYASISGSGELTAIKAGRKVTVTASHPSAGSASKTVSICKSMDSADITYTVGEQTYSGEELKPAITVKDGDTVLQAGMHYNYTAWKNNVNAGTAKAELTGNPEYFYCGSIEAEFTIVPVSLDVSGMSVLDGTKTYSLTKNVEVKDENGNAITDDDGNAIYESVDKTEDELLEEIKADLQEGYTAGDSGSSKIQITYQKDKADTSSKKNYLQPDVDYEIASYDFSAGASAHIMITGKGNYDGGLRIAIPIAKSIGNLDKETDIQDVDTVYKFHYTYTGKVIKPEITITDNGQTLIEGTHYATPEYYQLDGDNNTVDVTKDAGTKHILIKGKGIYAGEDPDNPATIIKDYVVSPKSIDSGDVTIDIPNQIKGLLEDNSLLQLSITFNGEELVAYDGSNENSCDYKVTIAQGSNETSETAKITIEGQNNFTGKQEIDNITLGENIADAKFYYVDSDSNETEITDGAASLEVPFMGGEQICPKIVLKNQNDVVIDSSKYDVEYGANNNAVDGSTTEGTIKVTGLDAGGYGGSKTITFDIIPIDLNDSSVTYTYDEKVDFNISSQLDADGNVVCAVTTPVAITYKYKNPYSADDDEKTYTLKKNTDYSVTYADNDKAGTAKIQITPKGGNFTVTNGSQVEKGYTIRERNIQTSIDDGNVVSVDVTKTPEYSANPDIDDFGIVVTHNGIKFPIGEYNLSGGTAPGNDDKLATYSYNNFTAEMTQTAGLTVFITVTGKGNYVGTVIRTVSLEKRSIGDAKIDPIDRQEYDKDDPITPEPKVTLDGVELVKDKDYTLSYDNNEEVGDGKVIVTGAGKYSGTKEAEFIIYKDISDSEDYADTIVVGGIPQKNYTGEEIKLTSSDIKLTDTLKSGSVKVIDASNYTLGSYQNNIELSNDKTRASVEITGKGSYYTGSRTVYFDIIANTVDNIRATISKNYIYTGEEIKPEANDITVTCNGKVLTVNTDYKILSYGNNINAANKTAGDNAPYVYIMGINGFGGIGVSGDNLKKVYFTILPKRLTTEVADYTYNYPQYPDKMPVVNGKPDLNNAGISVKDLTRGETLKSGTDYTLECIPDEGEYALLHFAGIQNYEGDIYFDVVLDKEVISQDDVIVEYTPQTFTYMAGNVTDPSLNPDFNLVVKKNDDTQAVLTYGTDYTIVPASGYSTGQFTNYNNGAPVKFGIKLTEYNGTLYDDSYYFTIAQKNIADSDVLVTIPNQVWDGSSDLKPAVTVTYNGRTLSQSTDYSYELFNCTAGELSAGGVPYAVVTARSGGNFYGKTGAVYFGTGADISLAAVEMTNKAPYGGTYDLVDGEFVYQGVPITPIPKVTLAGKELVYGTDFTVSFPNDDNVDASMPNEFVSLMRIEGTGDYAGTKDESNPFRIASKNIADSYGGTVSMPTGVIKAEFTGSPVEPELKMVYYGSNNPDSAGYTLKQGKDYNFVNGASATNVGTSAELTVSFTYNFKNVPVGASTPAYKTFTCQITAKSFKDAEAKEDADKGDIYVAIQNLQEEYEYAGNPIKPAITIKDIKRNADGTYREDGTLASVGTAYSLTTDDYDIDYVNNDVPGTAEIVVTGKGNYSSQSIRRTFKIKGSVDYATIEFTDADNGSGSIYKYTGKPVRPKVKVYFGDNVNNPLVGSTNEYDTAADYWVEYPSECTNVGTYRVVIHGINNYEESEPREKEYTVVPRDINDASVQTLGSFTYTGENIRPVPKLYYGGVLLKPDEDYVCTYETSTSAVNDEYDPYYTIQITGQGNFSGTYNQEVTYKVGNSFSEDAGISVHFVNNQTEFEYTGETIIPKILVYDEKYVDPLEEGVDYEIAIDEGNPEYINAGKKTFRIYGIDDKHPYIGDITAEFTITSIDLADTSVILIDEDGETFQKNRFQYYGREHRPTPAVTWKKSSGSKVHLSEENGDFVYSYKNNKNAGTATVTIGEGIIQSGGTVPNFTGSRDCNFTIWPIEVQEDSTLLKVYDGNNWVYTYTGEKTDFDISVEYNKLELTEGTDYDLISDYVNITENAEVEIRFKGNYSGSVTKTYAIRKRSLVNADVTFNPQDYKYKSEEWRPKPVVTYEGTVLTEGTDYKLTYDNNVDVGTADVYVTGINNYEGDKTAHFNITPINIASAADVEVVIDTGVIKDNQSATPEFSVYWVQEDGTKLKVYATDDGEAAQKGWELAYEYEYSNNTAIGMTGALTLTGKNNFTGTRIENFEIKADIEDCISGIEWEDNPNNLIFNNNPQKPKVKVNLTQEGINRGIGEGNDYEIVYEPVSPTGDAEAVNAGEYKVYVKGIGQYGGRSNELAYAIGQRSISNVTFTIPDVEFTGSSITPAISAQDTGLDPEVTLEEVLASDAGKTKKVNSYTTIVRGDTVNVGQVSVAISAVGTGNYYGSVTKDFKITQRNLVNSSVAITPANIDDQTYTGSAIIPEIKIVDTARNEAGEAVTAGTGSYELTSDDYSIMYLNNTYPGKASVTITGKGNYQNKLEKTFNIVADLSMAVIEPIPVQTYTGQEVRPALTVTFAGKALTAGVDYNVTYSNNINRGFAAATITAASLSVYKGEQTVTFEIGRDLSDAQLQIVSSSYTYTGSAIVPQIAVVYNNGDVLSSGTDYTVAYSNNVNVGTAVITVSGTGVYTGGITGTFQIVPKNVTRCSFSGVVTKQYDAKATSQSLTVKDGNRTLVLNQEYSIQYVNNVNPGTATIRVTGLGNYGGTKTILYNIEIKPMTTVKAKTTYNSVKLSWTKVDGAQGYKIYNAKNNKLVADTKKNVSSYTIKKLSSATAYSYKVRPYRKSNGATYHGDFSKSVSVVTNPKTPSVTVKAGSKKAAVKWKKISGANGYEVYRSTKKSSGYKKVKTIKKASTVSYTDKSVSKKKTYYYKVRAYKTVGKTKVYSSYSSAKKVKVK